MTVVDYFDFDLLIEREGDRYRAKVLSSPGGSATSDFELPFTREQLQIFILKAVALVGRRSVRRVEAPEMRSVKQFGRDLFDAVFDGEILARLRTSFDHAERERAGLRLRLRLDDRGESATAVSLLDVPWEIMYDPGAAGFLCLAHTSPVTRYPDMPALIAPFAVEPPLRILVMISSPKSTPACPVTKLDTLREWNKLEDALKVPVAAGLVTVDLLEDATIDHLQHRLSRGEYHVFHFIGHGGYDDDAGGVLLLEDGAGECDPVSAEVLRAIFHNHRPLRLAVLNSCEGARTDPTDPFAGVAQSLVQGGVSAVIAMQFEISDEAAITLSSEFYAALGEGYPVDAALAEARTAVFARVSAVEWATPVLYLRSVDGRIFDIPRSETVPKPPPPAPDGDVSIESPPADGQRAFILVDEPEPEPSAAAPEVIRPQPLQAALVPARAETRATARYELRITNPNSTVARASIRPSLASSSLLITADPESHEIQPGSTAVTAVRVKPRRPTLRRGRTEHAFSLKVGTEAAPASVAYGTFVQKRRVPLWAPALLLPLLVFLVIRLMSGGSPTLSYAQVVRADRPSLFCSMQNVDAPCDSSVHVVIEGLEAVEEGPFPGSSAAGFDGSTSWISLADQIELDDDFTIEAWVLLAEGGKQDHLLGLEEECGKNIQFAGKKFRLFVPPATGCGTQQGPSSDAVVSASEIEPGAWAYWVLTRHGSSVSLYRDGNPDPGEQQANAPPVGDLEFDAIGRLGPEFLEGSLAYIAIYEEALTAEAVAEHYAAARL